MEMREANQTEIKMARATINAAALQQGSYDVIASDEATAKDDLARAEWAASNPGKLYPGYGVDFKKFYKLSLEEASEMACAQFNCEGCARLIYLALDGWWNDTLDWANRILDETATCVPTSKYCQHGKLYNNNPPVEDGVDPDEKWACELCSVFYKIKEGK